MVTKEELYKDYLVDLGMIYDKYKDAHDDDYYKADLERKELKRQYNEDLLSI